VSLLLPQRFLDVDLSSLVCEFFVLLPYCFVTLLLRHLQRQKRRHQNVNAGLSVTGAFETRSSWFKSPYLPGGGGLIANRSQHSSRVLLFSHHSVELHLNEFRETKSDSFTEIRKPQTICSASFAKGRSQAQKETNYGQGQGWETPGSGVGNPRVRGRKPPGQGWETCDAHEHLTWPASEVLLPMLEQNIASKRSSMISRYLDSSLREVTFPHSLIKVEF